MADGDDLLKEAIAGTEVEIFSEAIGKDLPSTEGGPGDRSVEEMGEGLEGQLEADASTSDGEADGEDKGGDANDDTGKGEGDGKTVVAKDPKTGQFTKTAKTEGDEKTGKDDDADLLEADGQPKRSVPTKFLIAERKARQAAETRLKELESAPKTVAADEVERLVNARVAQLLGQQAPKQEPSAEAPAKRDMFEDPDGFVADLTSTITRDFTQKFVAADLARTHDAKPELFDKAYAALTSLDKGNPAARAQVQAIWNSPTPGADLLKWHGRQEAQRVVGDDPEAYAERIRTETRETLANDPEFRKQLLESLQQEARSGEGGTPRHVARMPKSLNGAAGGQSLNGGGGGQVDGSERGVFEDAFRG